MTTQLKDRRDTGTQETKANEQPSSWCFAMAGVLALVGFGQSSWSRSVTDETRAPLVNRDVAKGPIVPGRDQSKTQKSKSTSDLSDLLDQTTDDLLKASEVRALSPLIRVKTSLTAMRLRGRIERSGEQLDVLSGLNELGRLVKSADFCKLDQERQEKLLDVLSASCVGSTEYVLRLLNKLAPDGKTPLIDSRSFVEGVSFLDSLHKLATAPLNQNAGNRPDLINSVLNLTVLGYNYQAGASVCGASGVLIKLNAEAPAELLRIYADLLSLRGSVILVGGSVMQLGADAFTVGEGVDNRTAALRVLNTSFMDFAVPGAQYSNERDCFVPNGDKAGDKVQWGLYDHQTARLLSSIYNTDFEVFQGANSAETYRRLGSLSGGLTLMALNWIPGDGVGHYVVHKETTGNRDDRRVFFFNSATGFVHLEIGANYGTPQRRLEGRAPLLESMPEHVIANEQLRSIIYAKTRMRSGK